MPEDDVMLEIPDGWKPLVYLLGAEIRSDFPNYILEQVKIKWGRLSVSTTNPMDEDTLEDKYDSYVFQGIVDQGIGFYEELAARTCIECSTLKMPDWPLICPTCTPAQAVLS